jgi:hypothetical protein
MYCSKCGRSMTQTQAFCPSCGKAPGKALDPAAAQIHEQQKFDHSILRLSRFWYLFAALNIALGIAGWAMFDLHMTVAASSGLGLDAAAQRDLDALLFKGGRGSVGGLGIERTHGMGPARGSSGRRRCTAPVPHRRCAWHLHVRAIVWKTAFNALRTLGRRQMIDHRSC